MRKEKSTTAGAHVIWRCCQQVCGRRMSGRPGQEEWRSAIASGDPGPPQQRVDTWQAAEKRCFSAACARPMDGPPFRTAASRSKCEPRWSRASRVAVLEKPRMAFSASCQRRPDLGVRSAFLLDDDTRSARRHHQHPVSLTQHLIVQVDADDGVRARFLSAALQLF